VGHGDFVQLAAAIRGVLDDEGLRERIGTAGRAAVAPYTHAAAADAFGHALEAAGA
jgi:hypothetical protein